MTHRFVTPALVLVLTLAALLGGRRFSSRGTPRGERFLLTGFRPGAQSDPRVAASAGGEQVVVWTSPDELGPGRSDVLARRFAADGRSLGGRIPVNPSPLPKSSPDVAMDAARWAISPAPATCRRLPANPEELES